MVPPKCDRYIPKGNVPQKIYLRRAQSVEQSFNSGELRSLIVATPTLSYSPTFRQSCIYRSKFSSKMKNCIFALFNSAFQINPVKIRHLIATCFDSLYFNYQKQSLNIVILPLSMELSQSYSFMQILHFCLVSGILFSEICH